MATTNKAQHHKRATERFVRKHPAGYIKTAAKRKLAQLTAKQKKNVRRGKKGHTPMARKILSK